MMDELKTMTYEVTDRIARITLNRPHRADVMNPLGISGRAPLKDNETIPYFKMAVFPNQNAEF